MDGDGENDDAARRIEVPHAQLAPDVLRRLIEEFVTRDGTDYGVVERTLGEKVAVVLQQLEAGEAAIVVDAESETIDIVVRRPG
ncbi:MAG TPA: YheU family protein [Gaiellaceae bacterium]|nr:YheU family protein [Gaiellaceae bacterium]